LRIIVGLGNPGKNYELTRHNVGFRVLDQLATEFGAKFGQDKHLQAEMSKVAISANQVVLVKPTTFMNLSGLSVRAIASWYKVSQENILVIHDDVSLDLGRMRLQKGGGAGGQHGVESIIESLGGEKNFHRIKIGVGPDPGGERRADYVLSCFPKDEASLVELVIWFSSRAALDWLECGVEAAMNKFNSGDLTSFRGQDSQMLESAKKVLAELVLSSKSKGSLNAKAAILSMLQKNSNSPSAIDLSAASQERQTPSQPDEH
jgi:peptidyl-tRNA hydrolase, PTH1 family